MNVVKLMGGLGNQLFQYAFGRLQEHNGMDVAYDLSWFENSSKSDTTRSFLLDRFNIEYKLSPFLRQQSIHETDFDPTLTMIDNCNFWGYWQYLAYYDSILSDLQRVMVVKDEYYTPEYIALSKSVKNGGITALHVRRGDYLTTKGFKTLPFRYYYEALQLIKGDVFLFSDDLPWCKEKFKPEFFSRKITFVDLSDYLAFDLMRQCENHIISNSTFSILPAYLNTNKKKIVVGSKDTCIDTEQEKDKKNYLPKEWILI